MKLKKLTTIAAATATAAIAQTLVIASLYGIGEEVEIFFVSGALLSIFVQFTLSGRIGELFIPVYHQLQQEKGDLAAHRTNTLLLLGTISVGSILVVFALLISSPLSRLLSPGFSPERQAHLAQMLCVLTPCLVPQLVNANFTALATAERRFLYPEVGRLLGRLANIVTIVVCYPVLHEWALVAGYWISTACAVVASGTGCWKAGYRLERPSYENRKYLAPVLRATPASIASIIAQELYVIVLNAMLTFCPPGTLAIYNYCRRMIMRLTGIIIRPAAIVFHSNFSKQLSRQAASRKPIEAATEAILANTCVCVVAAWASLPNSMYFLFGVDKLSEVDIRYASIVLAALMVTYFAKGPATIARKTAVSLGKGALAYKIEAITNIVCLAIACLLIYFFQRVGLVTAVTFSAVTRAATAFLPLRDRADLIVFYRRLELQRWLMALAVSLSACVVTRYVLCSWVVQSRLGHFGKALAVTLVALTVLLVARRFTTRCSRAKVVSRAA